MPNQSIAANAESENLARPSRPGAVRVWDLPTRLFHWMLLVVVAIAWISAEADGALFNIHVISGIAVLAMIVFRLVWGFIGSRHALFVDFIRGWSKVREYARNLLAFKPPYHVGHNPIGGWMVVALLVTLMITSFSGLFISEDGYSGPLAASLSLWLSQAIGDFHEGAAGFLGFLVAFHVIGVVVHGLISRENLPRAMWTGDKFVPAGITVSAIQNIVWWRFLIALAFSATAVWGLLR